MPERKKKLKILIISYTFPPNPAIGGKRWAKFAKYLKKQNNDVYILTKKEINSNPIENYYYFNNKYPIALTTVPANFYEKIKYHLSKLYLNIRVKGTIYDSSVFLEKTITSKTIKIIKDKNIDTVIVTGAPFRLLYFISKIIPDFPNINFIADFRDPWTWGKGYGLSIISEKRKNHEKWMESLVLEKYNFITVPVVSMATHLKKQYPENSNKVILLPHGYDPDDIPPTHSKTQNKIPKIIYGGTLYDEQKYSYDEFCNFLNKNTNIANFYFYTNTSHWANYINNKVKHNNNMYFSKQLNNKMFLTKVAESDFFIAFYPDKFKNHFSTKFSEIIATKTPIIFVGSKGYISNFLIKNKLGYHIQPQNIKTDLEKIITSKLSTEMDFNSIYLSKFNISNITKSFVKLIKRK